MLMTRLRTKRRRLLARNPTVKTIKSPSWPGKHDSSGFISGNLADRRHTKGDKPCLCQAGYWSGQAALQSIIDSNGAPDWGSIKSQGKASHATDDEGQPGWTR